jgi:hypothetical protein
MKNMPTGKIVPDQYFWGTLYDALKSKVTKDGFYGDLAEILIQTSYPFTGQAFGQNVAIPYPDDFGFVKQFIPLKEVIVNAGITRQALIRATGGNASWGRAVDTVLQNQRRDFKWLMELASIGDGTGRLARVSAASHSGGVITITCDNTYADFGWENVALIKKGMFVEIYTADGLQIGDVATTGAAGDGTRNAFEVTGVTFGDRANGAATTGTFTIAVTNDITATTRAIENDSIVYLAGTKSLSLNDSAGTGSGATTCYEITNYSGSADTTTALPMGLLGIVQTTATGRTYSDGAIDLTMDTFQGLARASYNSLNAYVWQAGDFGGTDGTPTDWDLSVISDAMNQVKDDTGGETDLLLCSSQLAMAIHRRNRSEGGISVNVGTTGGLNQNAVGSQYASQFLCPDGRVIPIMVSKTIPANCLYGLCTEDLMWYSKGDFDFLRLNGDVWDKSYDDRYANFEAPFGGMTQLAATRCDRQFVIQDMKTNI